MCALVSDRINVDLVIPTKEQTLLEAYKQWRERADSKVCCDYGLHIAITHWNEQVAKDMEILTKEKGFTRDIYLITNCSKKMYTQ
ncbi:unnamed protein product [Rotaria sordida]|uniref:Uncharacterized protein n=1 Tax=Rotaria sordida TaxID=392033 RepID=A0A813ZBR9_9BILA|nr:unnamed protein product [Rotaria sordida]